MAEDNAQRKGEGSLPTLPDPTGRMFLPAMLEGDQSIEEAFGGSGEAAGVVEAAALRDQIVDVLREIYDPEIPLNIYDLGLIYGFDISDGGKVEIKMTLTAPGCPVAGWLVTQVAERVGDLEGVSRSHVKLVWDPPWTKDRMSEAALLQLGLL